MTKTIEITTEYITLTQLLKEENIISSGGQAKYYLMDFPSYSMVNRKIVGEKSYTTMMKSSLMAKPILFRWLKMRMN